MRRRGCRIVLLAVLWFVVGAAGPASAGDGGPWVWPVDGTVVRPFEPPATRYGPGHRGVDLAAAVGTPVRAAGAGRVSYAGLLAGRGVVVVVHGALRTTYEPVAASVRVGQAVPAGAVLGRLTSGGHCPDGCLHWGLLRGATYLDPLQLVRRGPSRLLPVPPEAAAEAAAASRADAPPAVRPAPAERSTPTPTARPARLRQVPEPGFSLRAAELPWGATAVVALLSGLILLRPRRPPTSPRPPRGPRPRTAAAGRLPAEIEAPEAVAVGGAALVDLGAERSRRRIA